MEVLLRAQTLFRGGSLEQAVELLEAHMASQPQDMRVAAALGRIYRGIKQPEKAAYWLRYSLENHDASPGFDEEDAAYLVGAAEEEPALELDYEYGVPSIQSRAANDDDSLQQVASSQAVISEFKEEPETADGLQDIQPYIESELPEEALIEPEGAAEESEAFKAEEGGQPAEHLIKNSEDDEVLNAADELADIPDFEAEEPADIAVVDDLEDEEAITLADDEEFGEGIVDLFEEADEEGDDDLESFYIELDPEDLGQDDEPEELPERLTHREKAEGIAAGLAVEGEWLKKDMGILVDVLAHHRSHGKTQSALRELLVKKQVTPAELHVLHELRKIWGSGGYNRTYRKQEAEDGWPNISWRLALDLTRALKADDAVEVLLFVEDCFQDWNASADKISAFPIFSYYLQHILDHMEQMALCCGQPPPAYIEYEFFEQDDDGWEQWHRPEPFNFNIYRESEDSQW
ncbi:hypothetical protein A15D_00364 [Alcanivorax sp. MD8A]|uniref:hypothetical protein n=1 Tax=Alcanivorax sp. MD8A TaxID=1177157 RepID=UPI000C9B484A|nr:hypothetical protein [Alcanivorax sp. MD8A]PNE04184.1 hypothetical protein A15D_00364 [Alcanivorax sp. MD8A]